MANEHPSEDSDSGDLKHAAPPAASSLSAKGNARRRFAKMGAGATGVLATLYSQPGMACTYCGLKPSGALSAMDQNKTAAQLSHHADCTEVGKPPSYWANLVPASVLFGDYFKCTGIPFGNVRARDLLNGSLVCYDRAASKEVACSTLIQASDVKVAQYLAAAMANCKQGLTTTLSAEIIGDIWNQWSNKRSYSPVPGRTWNDVDIVNYVYGTMD